MALLQGLLMHLLLGNERIAALFYAAELRLAELNAAGGRLELLVEPGALLLHGREVGLELLFPLRSLLEPLAILLELLLGLGRELRLCHDRRSGQQKGGRRREAHRRTLSSRAPPTARACR